MKDELSTDLIMKVFRSLDDRLISQEAMLQTMASILIKKELCTEEELETEFNEVYDELIDIKKDAMKTIMEETKLQDIPYYGPVGEA